MSFSYTLFLALLLLAPGLGVWIGLRAGERNALISQAPEKTGSTSSLLTVVFGALVGHILLSLLYVVQSFWCRATGLCFNVPFDPNVFRIILTSGRSSVSAPDIAFLSWFFSLLLPAAMVAILSFWASSWQWVRDQREASTYGWLKRWVDLAKPKNSCLLACVVTTLEHEGSNVAYQGIVENIALNDDRAITMLVLSNCDKFLVKVVGDSSNTEESKPTPIALIHLEAKNFVSVALEVFEQDMSSTQESSTTLVAISAE
jgi:hypothetical protein